MSAIVHYTECPVCSSRQINPLLTVKDHTVTGEHFVIWHCAGCTLRFTQDVPDESAINRYYQSADYISHTDTGKGLVNQLYKKVRNYTLQQKAVLLKNTTGLHKGRLLDVGCGTGAFLATMKEQGWEAEGLEPDPGARSVAKTLYGIEAGEPSHLFELQPATFNAITLWHVLEHVHQLHTYIAQLKTLLKPDGRLFIAVPNYSSFDAEVYRLNWAAYDVPRHLYHFTPKAIQTLMEKHGMKVIQKKPMWFDSFYISLLSSKYKRGKTGYVSAFMNGLRSNISAAAEKDKCSSLIYIICKS